MKGRIVVVEDDDLIAHLLGLILKRRGYAVAGYATTGEEALARVVETTPDLVLMDIRLNGRMDGIDAATHIQTILHTPVVFVTASADEETLARAARVRAYGYITKPFNEREIFEIIEWAIHQHVVTDPTIHNHLEENRQIPAVAITDTEDCIFYLNPAGESLVGVVLGKSLSRSFRDLVHLRDPVTNTMVQNLLWESTNGSLSVRDLSLLGQDGKELYVRVETCLLRNVEGSLQGALAILRPL